jgi:hypothetical protein
MLEMKRHSSGDSLILNRGHLLTEFETILHNDVYFIDNKTNNLPNPEKTTSNNHNILYFHWMYDTSGMSANTIYFIPSKNHDG